jgi:predicted TIM-barrel fold metal-dependent hydrolase
VIPGRPALAACPGIHAAPGGGRRCFFLFLRRKNAGKVAARDSVVLCSKAAFQLQGSGELDLCVIAEMMGAGVFERYSRLRVSFGESGAGWLPYALHRMDFEFEDRLRDLMKLKPSEYWRRQCKATFQFDPICTKLIDDIGFETLMWGSDYPHTDGICPESSKYIEEQFAGLSPDVVHNITCENAAKFYGLIN